MQCPACGFENDEGRPFCAACAEELVPGAAAEIEPPRERGPMRPARRVGLALVRAWSNCAASRLGAKRQEAAARGARQAALMLLALMPGLAHFVAGHPRLGCFWLGGFGLTLLSGWWLAGTPGQYVVVMAASGLVFTSVLDASRLDPTTLRRRPANASDVALALGLTLCAYGGLAALLGIFVEPASVGVPVCRLAPGARAALDLDGTVFRAGDELLFSRLAYRNAAPARGDIVRATVNDFPQMVRILAVPGDTLTLSGARLFLNGRPLPPALYPIEPFGVITQGTYPAFDHRLAAGEYAVWAHQRAQRGELARGPFIIGREAIRSKAWLVYGPPAHRRVINHLDPATGRVAANGDDYGLPDD